MGIDANNEDISNETDKANDGQKHSRDGEIIRLKREVLVLHL